MVNDVNTEPIAKPTKASRASTALAGGFAVLLLIVIFVAQNGARVKVNFLFLHGHMALGVLLLLAAVLGGLLTALFNVARILQLRLRVKRHEQATS